VIKAGDVDPSRLLLGFGAPAVRAAQGIDEATVFLELTRVLSRLSAPNYLLFHTNSADCVHASSLLITISLPIAAPQSHID